MKRLISAIAVLLLTGCVTPAAPSQDAFRATRIERGYALAEAMCSSCHAVGAQGESPAPEAPAFRRLSRDFRVSTLEGALRIGISTGHPAMPVMHLPPDDVRALMAYLNSVQEHSR